MGAPGRTSGTGSSPCRSRRTASSGTTTSTRRTPTTRTTTTSPPCSSVRRPRSSTGASTSSSAGSPATAASTTATWSTLAEDRAGRRQELPGPHAARGCDLGDGRRVRVAGGEPLRRHGQRQLEHGLAVRRGQRRRRAVAVAAPPRVLRTEQLGAAQRQRLGPRLGEPDGRAATPHCSSRRASPARTAHPASS